MFAYSSPLDWVSFSVFGLLPLSSGRLLAAFLRLAPILNPFKSPMERLRIDNRDWRETFASESKSLPTSSDECTKYLALDGFAPTVAVNTLVLVPLLLLCELNAEFELLRESLLSLL